MFENVLWLAMLIAGSVFASLNFEKKFEQTIPLSCMSIVFVIFGFGLFNKLQYGVLFIAFLAVFLYSVSLLQVFKDRKKFRVIGDNLLTPAFVLYCILFVLFSVFDRGMIASKWDEFSHWMDCIKAMVYLDDFAANPASNSAFQDYPPAMALFQYVLQKIYLFFNAEKGFSEWRTYLAYQMFWVSMLLPFLSKLSHKKPQISVLAAALILLSPLPFYQSMYTSVYIDPLVGILAGCGFLMIVLPGGGVKIRATYVTMICALLVLSKDVGIFFAVCIAIAFLSEFAFDIIHHREKGTIVYNLKRWGKGLSPLAAIFVSRKIWESVLKFKGAETSFGTSIDFGAYLRALFFRNEPSFRQKVVENFKKAFIENRIKIGDTGIAISYLVLTVILLLGIYLLCKRIIDHQPQRSRIIKMIFAVVCVQTIIYVFSLGATYTSKFSEHEALQLASYERYMNIAYLCLWIINLFGMFWSVQEYEICAEKTKLCCWIVTAALIFSPVNPFYQYINRDAVANARNTRIHYDHLANLIQQNCDGDDKIYYISQESNGFDYWITKFNARPNSVGTPSWKNYRGWSLGPGFYESDIYSIDITAYEWHDLLMESYDYVAIYRINDYFIETYGELFEDPQNISNVSLYSLNRENGLLVKCD